MNGRTKLKLAATSQILALILFLSPASGSILGDCQSGIDEGYCDSFGPEEINPGWYDWWIDGYICEDDWWTHVYADTGSSEDEGEAQTELSHAEWACEWAVQS